MSCAVLFKVTAKPRSLCSCNSSHRNPTLINSKGEECSVTDGHFVRKHTRVLTVTTQTYPCGKSSRKTKTRRRTYRKCSVESAFGVPSKHNTSVSQANQVPHPSSIQRQCQLSHDTRHFLQLDPSGKACG